MTTVHVAFLLNLFQPTPQTGDVVKTITEECYRPLAELFNSELAPKFTVSLTNSLAGLLMEHGCDDVFDELRSAVENGAVEFVHTGAYYPVFPLVPQAEVKRQLELDIEFKARYFDHRALAGVFSPELCHDDRLLGLYRQLGFQWTLVDDGVLELNGIQVPDRDIYLVDGFAVLLRSTLWSNRIDPLNSASDRYWTGQEFVNALRSEALSKDHDTYRIIALAGETFGHHIKYYQETFLHDMLFALQDCQEVHLCLVSELLDIPTLRKVEKAREAGKTFDYFPPCSWATQPENFLKGDPYPLWRSRGNPIHSGLWELSNLIFEACQNIPFENGANQDLRTLLDRAFYSTQYFWASVWFWDPKLVYDGIDLQMRALYKCARLTHNSAIVTDGQRIYTRLMWEISERIRRYRKNSL